MKSISCISSDGTLLHTVHNNRVGRPAIIFVHGACSSHRVWKYQFDSPLLDRHFHLIALDMRGHGLSAKPVSPSAYQNGQHWADDLSTVLDTYNLCETIVVAWSYGGRMVNDYIRHYGTSRLVGVNYIAAGTLATEDVKGPGYTVLADMFSDEPMRIHSAEKQFVGDLMGGINDPELRQILTEDLSRCPKFVRDAMRQREMDYDNLLNKLTCPVLLTHGEDDRYSLVMLAHLLNKHIPNTLLSVLEKAGHMPFAQCCEHYNQSLYDFVTGLTEKYAEALRGEG